MGKRRNSYVLDKQNQVIGQMQRDLKQLENRDWITGIERAIEDGRKAAAKAKPEQKPFISHYNPNNPLNGSSNWTRAEWQIFKTTGQNPRKK